MTRRRGVRIAPSWCMVSYPEHLANFDYIGLHRYFLRFCTFDRPRHFADAENVALVCEQFTRTCTEEHFAIPVYCFMPDHVHLLAEGTQDTANLLTFIKSAKQYSGFSFKQRKGTKLWQRYGFERVLRNDEASVDVARYIVHNPLRSRLVERIVDYAFWGSFTHTREALLEFIRRAA